VATKVVAAAEVVATKVVAAAVALDMKVDAAAVVAMREVVAAMRVVVEVKVVVVADADSGAREVSEAVVVMTVHDKQRHVWMM